MSILLFSTLPSCSSPLSSWSSWNMKRVKPLWQTVRVGSSQGEETKDGKLKTKAKKRRRNKLHKLEDALRGQGRQGWLETWSHWYQAKNSKQLKKFLKYKNVKIWNNKVNCAKLIYSPLKIFTPEKYSPLKKIHPWKIFTPEKYSVLKNIRS